jgi:hypothetical protein
LPARIVNLGRRLWKLVLISVLDSSKWMLNVSFFPTNFDGTMGGGPTNVVSHSSRGCFSIYGSDLGLIVPKVEKHPYFLDMPLRCPVIIEL